MSAPRSVRFRLALESFRENLGLVLRTWSGKIGIALLIIQLILALYALAAYFPTGTASAYMGSTDWVYYYPRAAPPCWATHEKVSFFKVTQDDFALLGTNVTKKTITVGFGVAAYSVYTIKTDREAQFTYTSKVYPQDLRILVDLDIRETMNLSNVKARVPPKLKLEIEVERPDGLRVLLFNGSIPRKLYNSEILLAGANESGKLLPVRLNELGEQVSSAIRIDPNLIAKSLQSILDNFNESIAKSLKKRPAHLLMTKVGPNGAPEVLTGTYKIRIHVVEVMDGAYYEKGYRINVTLKKFLLEPVANCYGLLGTDDKARPIGLGLLLGLPYAFLLGFIVTFSSTFIGAIYGTFAGYWKDYRGEALMRVADVFLSLPFLPILIALSYVFKGSINLWMLSFLMIVLFWAGPVIVVRSMALQISEQPYVEAAKAVGASTWRIVFRHVFPQIFPYTLAIAVLSIPGIIIAEASLALLGLGDPVAPTWGKMLQEAYNAQAVQNGLWWLYLFPGFALVVFSATFLLIGRAIEPLVAPKLQR